MDPLVPQPCSSQDVDDSETSPPPKRKWYGKRKKRVGKGVKQRKFEAFRKKKNAEWDKLQQEKMSAWMDSLRTDLIVENYIKQQTYERSRTCPSSTENDPCEIPSNSDSSEDISLDLSVSQSIISVMTTESILSDLVDPPALPEVCHRIHTPIGFYSNPLAVPCLLMDSSETHSLNYYFSHEQLVNDNPPCNSAAAVCKKDLSCLGKYPVYNANSITVNLETFSSDVSRLPSRDSLLIYAPDVSALDALSRDISIFNHSMVGTVSSLDFPVSGNKLCIYTDNTLIVKKWRKLRSIGLIHPALMWVERTGLSFPPEYVLFSSLLIMGKGTIVDYLGFVT